MTWTKIIPVFLAFIILGAGAWMNLKKSEEGALLPASSVVQEFVIFPGFGSDDIVKIDIEDKNGRNLRFLRGDERFDWSVMTTGGKRKISERFGVRMVHYGNHTPEIHPDQKAQLISQNTDRFAEYGFDGSEILVRYYTDRESESPVAEFELSRRTDQRRQNAAFVRLPGQEAVYLVESPLANNYPSLQYFTYLTQNPLQGRRWTESTRFEIHDRVINKVHEFTRRDLEGERNPEWWSTKSDGTPTKVDVDDVVGVMRNLVSIRVSKFVYDIQPQALMDTGDLVIILYDENDERILDLAIKHIKRDEDQFSFPDGEGEFIFATTTYSDTFFASEFDNLARQAASLVARLAVPEP